MILFKDSFKPDGSRGQPTEPVPVRGHWFFGFCRAQENDFTRQVLKTGTFSCKSSDVWLLWKNLKAWQGWFGAHVEAITRGVRQECGFRCGWPAGVPIRTPQPECCLAVGNLLHSAVLRSQHLQSKRIIRRPSVMSPGKSALHVLSAPWD